MNLERESVSASSRCNEYQFLQLEICGDPLGLVFPATLSIVDNHKLSVPEWNMMKY